MTFGIWWAHSMPSRDVNTNVVLDPMILFIIQGLEYIWQQYSFKHLYSHVCNCRDTEANKSLNVFRTDSYSVLSLFLIKLRYAYRRNRQNMFDLLVYFKIESEIAVKVISNICLFYLQKSIFCYSYKVLSPSSTNQNVVFVTWPGQMSWPTFKHCFFSITMF